MISSLVIQNYQSHLDTTLEFDPGVNIIIGSSRSGKTAVLRALNWNRYNKPAGLAINSYWNRDKKKLPNAPIKSIVKLGKTNIVRERDKTFNGYEIDGERYEAIGADVPDYIEKIWNMGEVNIQKQFDQPFLLSESAAEVARFFNKTIHLDKIDTVLSQAETKRQRTNKDIKEKTATLEELHTKIAKYDWIEPANSLTILFERFNKRFEEKNKIFVELKDLVEYVNTEQKRIDTIPRNLDQALSIMIDIEKLDSNIELKIEKETELIALLKQIRDLEHAIAVVPDMGTIDTLMDNIFNIKQALDAKNDEYNALNRIVADILAHNTTIESLEQVIENYIIQMPDICPACGNQIKKEI